jgi:hypothetical protein
MANRRFIDFPIASTVGDNDIVLIWQDGLNKQTTKGTLIQGAPTSLEGLTDVDIAGLINGQILQYNSVTGKWENVDRTGLNLSELRDVSIVSPSNGQVLIYNSTTSKWENTSAGFVPYTGAVTTVNLAGQTIQAGSFVKDGGTSAQFLKANGSVDSNTYLTTGSAAATYVPYTGANADVNLGTHDLTAERGTFQNNGSSDTLTVNHTSGSGKGINVSKGGNGEALLVTKTSGSGNAMAVVGGRTALVDLSLSSVSNATGNFLTISGGVVHQRTPSETRSDVGAQAQLNGTGFVKISGTTISYDNSTYLTTAAAASTYVPYTGATSGVDIGTYTLSANNLIANGGFNAGALLLKQSSNAQTIFLGYTAITPVGNNTLNFGFSTGSGVWKNFTLSSFLLTDNINRTYTLPDASGTIALVGGSGVGTVTSVAALTLGTSGTDLTSTVANGTTTPVITLNVPTASATNRGALSSADWSMFNAKQNALTNPVTGTGSSGQVAYWSSGSAITGESNLFWDSTNDRLGISNPSPGSKLGILVPNSGTNVSGLDVTNGANASFNVSLRTDFTEITAGGTGNMIFSNSSERFRIHSSGPIGFSNNGMVANAGTDTMSLGHFTSNYGWIQTWGGTPLLLNSSGNNVLIGTTTNSTFTLDVNGTGRFINNLTANSFIKSGGTSSQFLKADGSVDSTTYVSNVTASSPLSSSGGATPNVTIQQASGSQNGFLSSTDWTTFNNKQNALTNPVSGTGVNGRVAFWNGTNTITSDSDLLFNGNTLTLLTGNVEIAAGNGLILFNPNTTNYFQLYTNNGNELNFGFGGTTPVVAKVSSSGTMTLTGDIFIQKAAPSVQLRAGNGSNAGFILANSSNTHNWTFESDFGAAGQQGELRIRNSILGSNAITISTSNAATFSSSLTSGGKITSGQGAFRTGGFYVPYSTASTASRTWAMTSDEVVYGDFGIITSSTQTGDINTYRFYINPSGNVGIGTTNPNGPLNVKKGTGELVFSNGNGRDIEPFNNGSRSALDILSTNLFISYLGTGIVYSNGGVLTNTNPSDKNLKENITDLSFGLNEILQLRPVSYDWKNNRANQSTQYGFIAQEVQQILPQLVIEFDSYEDEKREIATKRLGLDKEGIFVALVKAIQELNEKIK